METSVLGQVFPAVLDQDMELILYLLDFITRTTLCHHNFLNLLPSHSQCDFSPASPFLFIPPCECPLVEEPHSIANFEVIGTLTINEGIFDTLEPLNSRFEKALGRPSSITNARGYGSPPSRGRP